MNKTENSKNKIEFNTYIYKINKNKQKYRLDNAKKII